VLAIVNVLSIYDIGFWPQHQAEIKKSFYSTWFHMDVEVSDCELEAKKKGAEAPFFQSVEHSQLEKVLD
jgi:hypothetical protein